MLFQCLWCQPNLETAEVDRSAVFLSISQSLFTCIFENHKEFRKKMQCAFRTIYYFYTEDISVIIHSHCHWVFIDIDDMDYIVSKVVEIVGPIWNKNY